MKKSPPQCPHCASLDTAPLVYGYPGIDMFEKEKKHTLKLGGCIIAEDNPIFHCFTCGRQWGRMADAYPEAFGRERQ